MRIIIITPLLLLFACAPVTQETLDRRDDREYEQYERELQFARDKEKCNTITTTIMIERWGKATRNQVIRNVPGRGDTWHCVYRR